MYQKIGKVDAIQRIDSITEHARVRNITETQTKMTASSSNQSNLSQEHSEKEDLERVTYEANKALETVNTQLKFRVHEGTGRPLIKLVESSSQEVIREIPSEKMLDVLAGIWEWAGLIVDRKE